MTMPGLASYEKRMRSIGLVVVGAAQSSEKQKALDVVKKAEVEFTITKGAKLYDRPVNGFPAYTLYDRNGEMVYKQSGAHGRDGLSLELQAAIEQALGEEANVLLIDVDAYREKPVVRFAKRASKGKNLGRLLEQIDETLAGGAAAEKDECQRLKATIIEYGERTFAEAQKLSDEWPHHHFDMMRDLSRAFKGHELGERAEAVYQSLKDDKQAKDEVAASRLYEELQLASDKDKPPIYRKIKKKYADTALGRRALSEMNTDHG